MRGLVAMGLRIAICVVGVLAVGAPTAIAQCASSANLESVSTEASRYSILSDALWVMGSDDVPECVDAAQSAVTANPASAEAHLRLGLAIRFEHPRSVALARSQYKVALLLDPAMLRAYPLMGELFSDEGDAAGVEQTYQAWLAAAPNDPMAHLSHAAALARLGKTPEAKAELERSLALGPTAAAYVSRALIAQGEGAPREAILADLDKALSAGGGEARIYHWRAGMHRQWGDTELALADVAKALEHAPDSFRLRQLRGEINGDAGRYDLAIAELDALIAAQPGWPDLVNDRCWTRAKAGRELEKALADCDTALGWEPGRAEALDSRGLVKLRLGDLPGAIADYDAALTSDPELTTSLFGRGVARRRSGDRAGGETDLDKARSLDPGIDKQFARFGVTP